MATQINSNLRLVAIVSTFGDVFHIEKSSNNDKNEENPFFNSSMALTNHYGYDESQITVNLGGHLFPN